MNDEFHCYSTVQMLLHQHVDTTFVDKRCGGGKKTKKKKKVIIYQTASCTGNNYYCTFSKLLQQHVEIALYI
jgi:hypothetical protein